jgi:hypothetical protein
MIIIKPLKFMLSKKLSKLILIGGIGALINSVAFFFVSDFYDTYFGIFFYFTHSVITILAGYFLLKQKKQGEKLLMISFYIFILSLFIPAPFLTLDGDSMKASLFIATIVFSALAVLTGFLIFVPVFTTIFIFSVFRGSFKILKRYYLNKNNKIIN